VITVTLSKFNPPQHTRQPLEKGTELVSPCMETEQWMPCRGRTAVRSTLMECTRTENTDTLGIH